MAPAEYLSRLTESIFYGTSRRDETTTTSTSTSQLKRKGARFLYSP